VVFVLAAAAGAMPFQPGDIVITEFFEGWLKIDPISGNVTELPFEHTFSSHIAFDLDGNLLFADDTDSISKLDVSTGHATPLPVVGVQFIDGFVVEAEGSLLVAEDNSVDRFVPSGPSTSSVASRDFFGPAGIARGDDGRVYVTEFFEDLWEVNPANGALSPVTSMDLNVPDLIVVRPDGNLIVHDFNNHLLKINPDTGSVTTYSENLPTFPQAITVEADGDLLMTSTEGVFRFDASTGMRTLLAEGTFFNPHGIAVMPELNEPLANGDYNRDGIVNAADYVVWRNNASGEYTNDDYLTWRDNFGAHGGVNTARAVVPEPGSALLLLISAATPLSFRRRCVC
jgi:hypothetical protein